MTSPQTTTEPRDTASAPFVARHIGPDDAAVAHILEHRELRPDEWFETPKPTAKGTSVPDLIFARRSPSELDTVFDAPVVPRRDTT